MSFTPEQLTHIDALIKTAVEGPKTVTPQLAGDKMNMFLAPTLASQEKVTQRVLKTTNTPTDSADKHNLWVKLTVENSVENKLTNLQNFLVFTTATSVVAAGASNLRRMWEDEWECNPRCDEECEPEFTVADKIHYYGGKVAKYSAVALGLVYYGKTIYSGLKSEKNSSPASTINPNLSVV